MDVQAALPPPEMERVGVALDEHRAARGVVAACRIPSAVDRMPSITALLGPTNTGQDVPRHGADARPPHGHDRVPAPAAGPRELRPAGPVARGGATVALVTGEERIVPRAPSYFVCTVEAMPLDRRVDFLAVDEIQLCADRERGHVFTDRLLHARGPARRRCSSGRRPSSRSCARWCPEAAVIGRPRLSTLTYAAPRKIARLPRRTAHRRLLGGGPLRGGRPRPPRDGRRGAGLRRALARAPATRRSRSTRRARSTTWWPPTPSAWA